MSKGMKMANFLSIPRHPATTELWSYANSTLPSRLRIALWNVNGVRSILKKGTFHTFLEQYSPDILCLNETKLDLEAYKKNPITLPSYHGYWNFCKVSAGYSGVATFSKYKAISCVEDFPCGHLALEGRCLTLQFEDLYVVNVYKPNSGANLERLQERTQTYDSKFTSYVTQLKQKKKVIITGDMNVAHHEIDLARPKQNRMNAGFTFEERDSFSALIEHGFYDSYRVLHPDTVRYSWWSFRNQARAKNIGWRIDYILSSDKEAILQADILNQVEGSDHCPVISVVSL